MAIELPLVNNPYYSFSISIENVVLNFDFMWSTREQSWYFNVKDSKELPIINNIKLMPFTDLTLKYPSASLPPGVLYCLSLTNDLSPPGRNDLGDRIRLYYVNKADLT